MAEVQISILSSGEIESLHQKTLEILMDPGVSVLSTNALAVLESAGAAVDQEAMRARIPESLVKETLEKLPRTVTLAAREPKRDMTAPRRNGPPFMATNGTAVYMTDLVTGEKRRTTGKDLKDFMVLCDAMDPLDYVWPIVTAHDAPEKTHAVDELAISLLNTTKHVQGEAMSAAEARAQIEIGAAIAGSPEDLAKRPLFSVIQCPICPLEFERGSIEATMEFAKAGIPVVSMSMALCGLTSPVTLASTLAIVNAENIASFAISQMTKAGAPVIYSSESTAPNMMTGEIHYGALEEILLASASAQMAHHYGVPSMVGGFCLGTGGDTPGINVDPAELAFGAMTSMTATDFASGIGGLDQAKGASLEQVIIDCDVWEIVREMRKEIWMDDAHFLIDLIRSVGPGGSFLKELHTTKNLRKELFMPTKEKADVYSKYRLGTDWKDAVKTAREKAKVILSGHVPNQADDDVISRVHEILHRPVAR
jgi:trimethylamine--corrinoid protein Co-methyltransferase